MHPAGNEKVVLAAGSRPHAHEDKERQMKKFMAVFTGNPDAMSAWRALESTERQRRETEGMYVQV
jgi:hypothetical protein